ncbi:porin [Rhizobium sp. Rhizsp82]|uniref:porin n=1 Tax=Rhizobium sp. Rhizsp82 TaxID=3243057 RepID=UPI0039B523B7
MHIKTVLFASAAALAAVSGAHAADAIVAAEPEPVEYVRVCDAYGSGYFYIPGTETCLAIGGYLRSEVRFGDAANNDEDWSFFNRAQVTFSSKSDTEYGTLTGVITYRIEYQGGESDPTLDEGYIELAGFRFGKQYSWWDDDATGETDILASNETTMNSIRYQYESGDFAAGISLDEIGTNYIHSEPGSFGGNDLGIASQVSGKFGAVTGYLLAGYDTDENNVAIRAIVYADLGPGTLGLYGVWTSGINYYYEASEWTVGAQYEYKLTDKWAVTPGFQYFGNVIADADDDGVADGGGYSNRDAWAAGVTVDYKVVEDLKAKLSLQYRDEDDGDDGIFGFMRLQRDF